MSIKRIGDGSPEAAARFLYQSGLLFEINRRVLHPLGLALEIQQDDEDSDKIGFGGLWDYRNDPEGLYFDAESFDSGAARLGAFLGHDVPTRFEQRERTLGFVIQVAGVPDDEPEEKPPEG